MTTTITSRDLDVARRTARCISRQNDAADFASSLLDLADADLSLYICDDGSATARDVTIARVTAELLVRSPKLTTATASALMTTSGDDTLTRALLAFIRTIRTDSTVALAKAVTA